MSMKKGIFGKEYAKELKMEEAATRKCLERVPPDLFDWKPHDKSMKMSDLAMIVSEIPGWIVAIAKDGDIDLDAYETFQPKDTQDLLKRFDKNMKEALAALEEISDKELEQAFTLRSGEHILDTSSKKDSISSSINHLVHHRGQLTVYIRLNNLAVPSIYGPSADENPWM